MNTLAGSSTGLPRVRSFVATSLGGVALVAHLFAQTPPSERARSIPPNATALEGEPRVRVDVTSDGATRRELDTAERTKNRLSIQIRDGKFFWGSREQPLTVTSSGDFTYLSTAEPGRYVRFTRVSDKLTYVEHVDTALGGVLYWGELRIVVRK